MGEEFTKKCETIFRQIEETYPDYQFIYKPEELYSDGEFKPAMRVRLLIAGCIYQIFIFPETTWDCVQKMIKIRKEQFQDDTCAICYEKVGSGLACFDCNNWQCEKCTMTLFRNGKGVITCPFCRKSKGYKIPDHALELFATYFRNNMFPHK